MRRRLPLASAVLLSALAHGALALMPGAREQPALDLQRVPPSAPAIEIAIEMVPAAPAAAQAARQAEPVPEAPELLQPVPSSVPRAARTRTAPPLAAQTRRTSASSPQTSLASQASPEPTAAAPPAAAIQSVAEHNPGSIAVPALAALGGLTGPEPPGAPPATGPAAPAWNPRAYGELVRQHIDAHKRYPARARRLGQQGEAIIAVRLDAHGQLAAPPWLVRSSGADALDREALRMARAAAPYPRPPAARAQAAARQPLTVHVPVRFSLDEP